jgi:glycosyltransferase involved in cell wall biosynthesis
MTTSSSTPKLPFRLGVVIPCFNVKNQIVDVISSIPNTVTRIVIVDDKCPEETGKFVLQEVKDSRIQVIFNQENLGVGGAMKNGYRTIIETDVDIIVKVDGDGQMDLNQLDSLIEPIVMNRADYTKGNRFYKLSYLRGMPKARIFGNLVLSFLTKLSTGYYRIIDPNNGYTAIHISALKQLSLGDISNTYFFESDMLYQLNMARAVIEDVPMQSVYGNEKSNLKIHKIFLLFLGHHIKNISRRIFYNYYFRDFSVASIELPLGLGLLSFGLVNGFYHWIHSSISKTVTPIGSQLLVLMTCLLGTQFLLAFLSFDIANSPTNPISRNTDNR